MTPTTSKSSIGKKVPEAPTISRQTIIAGILLVALLAFEIFNFDTTQYALEELLGDVRFMGIMWATILAIAFCAIDFAGLVRIITPQRGTEEPKVIWFLTGAWFLGTLANAVMTWWAVSLTLLDHNFGNEVLSREQLLLYVPIFVAGLVWLTRILFIGAFSVAGEEALGHQRAKGSASNAGSTGNVRTVPPQPAANANKNNTAIKAPAPTPAPRPAAAAPAPPRPTVTYEPVDDPVVAPAAPAPTPTPTRDNSRIRQRPPVPGGTRVPTPGMQAKPNDYRP